MHFIVIHSLVNVKNLELLARNHILYSSYVTIKSNVLVLLLLGEKNLALRENYNHCDYKCSTKYRCECLFFKI